MNPQSHSPHQPTTRRHYAKNHRHTRRHVRARNGSRQRLMGPASIAAYLFNDPQMASVVVHLANSGQLGHHYVGGVLCSTRTACRLCMARMTMAFDDIETHHG